MRLAELFIEAGLPAGVFQVVHGDKEAVDAILEHPEIQAVGFVGSSDIAQYIYAGATANGKRAQCFGGAKNHMIVMPDAVTYRDAGGYETTIPNDDVFVFIGGELPTAFLQACGVALDTHFGTPRQAA